MRNKDSLVKPFAIVILVGFLFLVPTIIDSPYWVSVFVIMGINVLLTASLRTIGLLNQTSLGHVGFTLIGAYVSAILMMQLGLPFGLTLLIAGLAAGLVGLALGYPFLRVKGIYFTMLTLLTAETFRLGAWNWKDMTGGALGLVDIPSPGVMGPLDFSDVHNYYYLMLFVVGVSLFVLFRLEHSPLGFRWRAIRDAENLAQSVGINSIAYKMFNFAIACFFAGIAGALFAHYQHGLSADIGSRFGVIMSLYLVMYMFIGGQSSFAGPIVGVIVLTFISEFARPLKEFQPMLIGAIAILVAVFLPTGLVSLPEQIRRRFVARLNSGQE
ncbi:hypothetical protein ANRL3_02435 [Anaerolineae bacterium]|nr:hypothetical protein ANRL3_02435 [Anaerolineae bacterium]